MTREDAQEVYKLFEADKLVSRKQLEWVRGKLRRYVLESELTEDQEPEAFDPDDNRYKWPEDRR